MREGRWGYEVEARCSLESAVSLMSDIERLGEVHPLVVNVVEVDPAPGALRTYSVTDRLRWGPFRFPITYHADVLSVADHEVVTTARQRPRTTLLITSTLSERAGGVRIAVEVLMRAPSVLFGYAYRTGKAAHLELAVRIKTALEHG